MSTRFEPNHDRSIARQLACTTPGEWWELMRGHLPIQAIHAMSLEFRRGGRSLQDVLLDTVARGALIFINENDQADIDAALAATGRAGPS